MNFMKFVRIDELPSVGNIILEVVVLAILGLIAIKLIMIALGRCLHKSSTDPVLYAFIRNAVKVMLIIVLCTMCLGVIGVPMTSLVAVIGAAGAAIALALRDSLANIAGGVMIIITKPFNQGDLIDVNGVSGRVEKIDLFITTLKTVDNKTVTIPNGLVNTSVLINHSRETERRVDCQFGISYKADIALAKSALWDVIAKDSRIFTTPEPIIGVAEHADSAIILDCKVWCTNDDYWDVKYSMEENVKLAFDEKGIEIPFNQLDVHLKDSVKVVE